MSPRGLADQPLTAATAAAGADHFGGGPSLVNKHQALGIELGLLGLPVLAPLSDVGPRLLGGVQSFF